MTHKEKMDLRKEARKKRIATLPDPVQVPQWGSRNKDGTLTYKTMYKVRPIKTGKYGPKEEDKKHAVVS